MLFLRLVNVFFMVAEIFLNAVVIISLRWSSQLRKKLCHFMIFVLTCFDLAVITISQPVIILSTIFWSKEVCSELLEQIRTHISGNIYVLSTTALLIVNIERLLGMFLGGCLFFHLLLSANYIFCFAFDVRSAIIR
jgi:hypothetical protein